MSPTRTRTVVRATAVIETAIGYQHPSIAWNGLTVTDLFCGAGGSSSGLVAAGYRVVIAANHWARAIESHQLNHPETDHSSADISQVNPSYFPRTDILWASPECTNHSVAKGVKRQRAENAALFELDGTRPLADEAANRSRATMWDVPRFAEHHKYRAIIIENVVDAYRWIMFPAWLQAMELLGYEHEIVWQNSMHAQAAGLPAPQSRDRMYVVFWRKDAKRRPNLGKWTRPLALCTEHGEIRAVQTFKKAERWGRYRAQYLYRCPKCAVVVEPAWLPALSAIDPTIQGERIGDRKKALAAKTRKRAQDGILRYWAPIVLAAAGNTYDSASGKPGRYLRAWPVTAPLRTQNGTAEYAIAVPPLLVPVEGRDGKSAATTNAPMRTQSTRNETGLLVPYYGTGVSRPVSEPMGSVTTVDRNALLVPAGGTWRDQATSLTEVMPTRTTVETDALLIPMRNHGVAKPATHPIDTVSANGNHHALVMRNNTGGAEMSTPVTEPLRTLTTGGHQSVLEPGEPISLDVDDAMFRMLEPHEIKLGMAFAADYVLLGTKREQVKRAGNAVTPPMARDLGYAVAEHLLGEEIEVAA